MPISRRRGPEEAMNLAGAAVIDFPLRGEWVAIHTPAERIPSHGTDYLGQRYAFDFVRLAPRTNLPYERGFWRHLLATLPCDRFLCWDEPVLSSFDGTVVAAADGWPDGKGINLLREMIVGSIVPPRPRGDDFRPLTGNYVLVEGAEGVAVYAHLREGSVAVRPGERVRAGQPLGRVGNSGNSTMPHLHFHLMDGPDLRKAAGLPCAFRSYERFAKDGWEPVAGGVPGALERIRVPPAAPAPSQAGEPAIDPGLRDVSYRDSDPSV